MTQFASKLTAVEETAALWAGVEFGSIKYFSHKGFGFIEKEHAQQDIYFHVEQFAVPNVKGVEVRFTQTEQPPKPNIGDEVAFKRIRSRKKNDRAGMWCFFQPYADCLKIIETMPFYRAVRVEKIIGKPVADPVNRRWVDSVAHVDHVSWQGKDLDALRGALPFIRQQALKYNQQIRFDRLNLKKQIWEPCNCPV